ncbi:type II secretion system F family protein [Corallococcus sp. CA049B]|uniref:Type II secretion system protein F domain-containing protein n=1 Tax=Corallococcus coralloides TaxID=184914 RepID=A0A410RW56_CORCK|nr:MULTISPECIES: type II secretion system F family protein [Corallococcus]NOJ98168.1 type II secretion system F family protein [Corallococcus coralloides]QAT86174.1 type II secretion system protein F domain-containing protein [Corallococcus coralloides]RKG76359.1 type II secretion system F family protein [Corallococcus sp. CA049B]
MQEVLTFLLMGGSALLTAGAVAFLGIGLYSNLLERFLTEVRDESAGGMKGAGSVAIRKLGSMNRRFMWPGYESKTRRKLIKAGEPSQYKPEDIMALQEVSAFLGLLVGLFVANGIGANLAWSLVVMLLGLFYPLIWLNDQVKRRHLAISRALPYNLDLLTLSVEAGMDFTGALAKVVEKGRQGPLREELQLVLKQLKMGKTREEGLKSMIVRVDLPSLTTFVTALIQADKMGTSLGKVLRIQSTQMRIDRTQRAEKLAGEAPVKMLFPLIACIFPTVFMVLFGPIVFQFMFGNVGG